MKNTPQQVVAGHFKRWLRAKTFISFHGVHLFLLNAFPLNEINTNKPIAIRIYCMADAGGDAYEQVEWEMTEKEFPWLSKTERVHLAIDIWEGADKQGSLSATANLLPDRLHNPLPCKFGCQLSTSTLRVASGPP